MARYNDVFPLHWDNGDGAVFQIDLSNHNISGMRIKQVHFIFSISIYLPVVQRAIEVNSNGLELRESGPRTIYLFFSQF